MKLLLTSENVKRFCVCFMMILLSVSYLSYLGYNLYLMGHQTVPLNKKTGKPIDKCGNPDANLSTMLRQSSDIFDKVNRIQFIKELITGFF